MASRRMWNDITECRLRLHPWLYNVTILDNVIDNALASRRMRNDITECRLKLHPWLYNVSILDNVIDNALASRRMWNDITECHLKLHPKLYNVCILDYDMICYTLKYNAMFCYIMLRYARRNAKNVLYCQLLEIASWFFTPINSLWPGDGI